MTKIVLTGGPCAGKTTLAERLRELGCAVAPEAALRVIRALERERGAAEAERWRRSHHHEFQARIAALQVRLEAEAERHGAEIVVCDRGVPDGLAYCRHFGIEPPPAVVSAARAARYDHVFVLDTLTSFRARAETGRIDDHGDSIRLQGLIERVYREHQYTPAPLPELSVEQRLEHVRRVIGGP